MGISTADERISSFCAWLGVSVCSAFLGGLIFIMQTLMMNPAANYWATVLERAQSDLFMTTLFGLSCIGVIVGVVLMLRAIIGGAKQSRARSEAE